MPANIQVQPNVNNSQKQSTSNSSNSTTNSTEDMPDVDIEKLDQDNANMAEVCLLFIFTYTI